MAALTIPVGSESSGNYAFSDSTWSIIFDISLLVASAAADNNLSFLSERRVGIGFFLDCLADEMLVAAPKGIKSFNSVSSTWLSLSGIKELGTSLCCTKYSWSSPSLPITLIAPSGLTLTSFFSSSWFWATLMLRRFEEEEAKISWFSFAI